MFPGFKIRNQLSAVLAFHKIVPGRFHKHHDFTPTNFGSQAISNVMPVPFCQQFVLVLVMPSFPLPFHWGLWSAPPHRHHVSYVISSLSLLPGFPPGHALSNTSYGGFQTPLRSRFQVTSWLEPYTRLGHSFLAGNCHKLLHQMGVDHRWETPANTICYAAAEFREFPASTSPHWSSSRSWVA